MKALWNVYRELPWTDGGVIVDTFHNESDACTYADMRNRAATSRYYFVAIARAARACLKSS